MEKVRRHSRLCRKASGIATAIFFAFLSLAPAHAGIYSGGDVFPVIFWPIGDLTLSTALMVGNTFPGSVSIEEGSTLTTLGGAFIGNLTLGTMDVFGTWNDDSFISIGHWPLCTGELNVGPVGALNGNRVTLGVLSDSIGDATVLGTLNAAERLVVGRYGSGSLTIQSGGEVNHSSTDWMNFSAIGLYTDSDGTVIVTGAGSTWTDSDPIFVGYQGAGNLTIQNGGTVTSTGVYGSPSSGILGLNAGSEGTATVTGAGSTWTNNGDLGVGIRGRGSLTVADGGMVNCDYLIVAFHAIPSATGSEGTVTITGAGSILTADEYHYSQIGNMDGDKGSLFIENGGKVQVQSLLVGRDEGSEGVVVVKNATLEIANILDIGYDTYLPTIPGKGRVRLVHGTVTASVIRIGGNGFLVGTGTITGNVNLVEDGGRLSPGLSPGQMIINGDLNFTHGLLELEADSPSLKDELVVSGNVHIGPEAIFNIFLGFELIEPFNIGDFFFGSSASFTVDTDFQADQINLFFTADSGMTNGEIVNITLGGRELSVPATVEQPTCIEVSIDIKPGSNPNSINPNAGGVIPVAILTTADFDASTVDPETVALNGAGARGKGKSGKYGSIEDVDGDGDLDLVVQIENVIEWDPEATKATLTGQTYDGIPIQGTDTVNIVPPE